MRTLPARAPVIIDNAKLLGVVVGQCALRKISLRKAMCEAGLSPNVTVKLREPDYVPDGNTFAALLWWSAVPLGEVVRPKPEEAADAPARVAS